MNDVVHAGGNEVIFYGALLTALAGIVIILRRFFRNVRRMVKRTNALLDGFIGVEADPDLGIKAQPGVLERVATVETLVAKELTKNGGSSVKDRADQAVATTQETQRLLKKHLEQAAVSERDLDAVYQFLGLTRGSAHVQSELPFATPNREE